MKLLVALFVIAPLVRGTEGSRSGLAATYCRAADSTSSFLISQMKRIATATEEPYTTMRDSLKIPAVSASQVTLVTQEATCKKAGERLDAEIVRLEGTPSVQRKIYLIKMGNTYAAIDTDYKTPGSEWRPMVIMTNQYKFLSVLGK